MKNISINNETLELSLGKSYYIIDALYLNDIKKELLNNNLKVDDIRDQIFPYTDTPFAQYTALKKIFSLNQIKKVDYDEVILGDFSFFSTDTGLIVFINEKILIDFIKSYDYENLVDSEDEFINENYWKELASKFDLTDLGLILASIDLENDFEGSGTYKITTPL